MENDVVCEGLFRAAEGAKISCLDQFQQSGFVQFVLGNVLEGFYNFFAALLNPGMWLNWSDPQAIMRFIYYGGSVEFFFVCFNIVLILTAVGIWRRNVMWACVRGLEWLGNGVGRLFAWAGLLMVLQQIIIVFLATYMAILQPDTVLALL